MIALESLAAQFQLHLEQLLAAVPVCVVASGCVLNYTGTGVLHHNSREALWESGHFYSWPDIH